MFHKGFAFLLALFILVGFAPLSVLADGAEAPRVVRVAYPIQEGLTEISRNGDYTGYTYEYLQEIAQYVGWKYEFVEIPGGINDALRASLEMLEKGEVDLSGGLLYSDDLAKVYDYPDHSYGASHTVLVVHNGNTQINATNYVSAAGMRVGVLKNAVRSRAELDRFCSVNDLQFELVEFDKEAQAADALRDGRIDAMLGMDMGLSDGVRIIADVATHPFYFATTKGNQEIIEALNMGIQKVDEADPYFASDLFDKYFGSQQRGGALSLTEQERQYIKGAGTLRVATRTYEAPMQYYSPETGESMGIAIDFLECIARETGLEFEYITADSQEELQRLLVEGQCDLVAGIDYNYNLAEEFNVALTRPFLSASVILAINNDVKTVDLSEKTVALPVGFGFLNINGSPVVWYGTQEECITAVNRNMADYSFGNVYALQYYTNKASYRNVSMIPQSTMVQKISVGVAKPVDTDLMTILNKAVGSISDAELEAIIYRNTVYNTSNITLLSFIDSNPQQVIGFVLVVSAAIIIMLVCYLHAMRINSRHISLVNERYEQLSELSNEYLYEYDILRDKLMMTEKSAKHFGCQRNTDHFTERLRWYKQMGTSNPMLLDERIISSSSGSQDLFSKLPNGESRWLRVTSKVIMGDDGKPIYSIGKIADIQEEKAERKLLEEKALKDGLTDLFNGATCRNMAMLALESNEPGALIIIDVDNFKEVNDRYGHLTGDRVLAETAQILKSVFRREDIVGRLGGDEFMVFMRGVRTWNAVKEKCELLKRHIHKISTDGHAGTISLSVGVVFAQEGQKFNELYQKADEALYMVKNRGRNGYEIV